MRIQPFTISAESSILDILQVSKYISAQNY